VVSHRSAAALLGLLDRDPASIDVIAPSERGRKIAGIRVHMISSLRPEETGTVDGIPCTSPARTLVDLAGTVGVRTLRSCFERAAARRMLDLDAIEGSMTPGRRGMPALRALIQEWRPVLPTSTQPRLKSPLEAMVLPLLARRGVPAPQCNAPVELVDGRIEVDFLWAEQRFVLEADSRDFHAIDAAFERDRWRDRELMRVGYESLRVTRLQAETEAEEIAETVRGRLRAVG
jgi:transcriptional regulator with AbiEi antitoxin domain of type IV toxin-antitoxin system